MFTLDELYKKYICKVQPQFILSLSVFLLPVEDLGRVQNCLMKNSLNTLGIW